MFGIGTGELLLVLVVVFLIYGPKRLPELAQKLGRFANDLRKASDDVKSAVSEAQEDIQKPFDDRSSKNKNGSTT